MMSSNSSRKLLFTGPTYASLAKPKLAEAAGFEVRPPAGRGDLGALLDHEPGTVVLVDGNFQQRVAVGHAELRKVLCAGWAVWGLGSLGAIRAFEMRDLGMRGYGRVFSHFLAPGDFQDDEVALLHSEDAPYVPASEPLIHLRYALVELERRKVLARAHASAVVADLKARWFGFRSLDLFVERVGSHAGREAARQAKLLTKDFGPFRVKSHDLERFLATAAWLNPVLEAPLPVPYLIDD